MELMTANELAEYLGVTSDTIYRKARTGEIPSIRIGRLLRFSRETIETWLRQGATHTGGVKGKEEEEIVHVLLNSTGVCAGPEDLSDAHDKYLYGDVK